MSERPTGIDWIKSRRKRQFDTFTAAALLPIATPIMTLGALAFLLENNINPLFIQQRLDGRGADFRVVKLRTMPFKYDLGDSSNGYADSRATTIGRVLRKTTIDELPQLFQILAGTMSVIGPRPLLPTDVENTLDVLTPSEQIAWQEARSLVKPGLLSEFGNMSRQIQPQSTEYLLARVEADLVYAETASAAVDLQIIQDAAKIGSSVLHSARTRL